nr:hypothetical protein [Nonomuraea sp. FMUSA5-5]
MKSRCTTPAAWMAASAVAVLMASRCRAAAPRGPLSLTESWSEGPSTYSLTMYGRAPTKPESSSWAVQNGATRSAVRTSRRNLVRASSSAMRCECSSLTATSAPPGPRPV